MGKKLTFVAYKIIKYYNIKMVFYFKAIIDSN